MIKKTITTLSVVALAAGTAALPAAAAGISAGTPVQIAACGQESVQPVRGEESLCGKEPVQPVRGEKPVQPLCCEEKLKTSIRSVERMIERPPHRGGRFLLYQKYQGHRDRPAASL